MRWNHIIMMLRCCYWMLSLAILHKMHLYQLAASGWPDYHPTRRWAHYKPLLLLTPIPARITTYRRISEPYLAWQSHYENIYIYIYSYKHWRHSIFRTIHSRSIAVWKRGSSRAAQILQCLSLFYLQECDAPQQLEASRSFYWPSNLSILQGLMHCVP